jgi:hypothetical protein
MIAKLDNTSKAQGLGLKTFGPVTWDGRRIEEKKGTLNIPESKFFSDSDLDSDVGSIPSVSVRSKRPGARSGDPIYPEKGSPESAKINKILDARRSKVDLIPSESNSEPNKGKIRVRPPAGPKVSQFGQKTSNSKALEKPPSSKANSELNEGEFPVRPPSGPDGTIRRGRFGQKPPSSKALEKASGSELGSEPEITL